MPTPTKGPRLGGGPAHERIILANLAQSLFEHRQIKTTQSKAKRLQPYAERLITFAKRGDLAARRRVLGQLSDKTVVHELFTEIAPAMAERNGGYTRITKIGNRKGDNAPMALIELVLEPVSPKQAVVRDAEKVSARAAEASEAEVEVEAPAETEAEATEEVSSPSSPSSASSPSAESPAATDADEAEAPDSEDK